MSRNNQFQHRFASTIGEYPRATEAVKHGVNIGIRAGVAGAHEIVPRTPAPGDAVGDPVTVDMLQGETLAVDVAEVHATPGKYHILYA